MEEQQEQPIEENIDREFQELLEEQSVHVRIPITKNDIGLEQVLTVENVNTQPPRPSIPSSTPNRWSSW